jgi:hypothetical protein
MDIDAKVNITNHVIKLKFGNTEEETNIEEDGEENINE